MQRGKAEVEAPSNRTYSSEPDGFRWRWQHVKRLTREQLAKLHEIEVKWEKAEREVKAQGKFPEWPNCWKARGHSWMTSTVEQLGPFWPARAPEAWKEAELARWRSYSFRLWRPIWDKYDRNQINELEAVHAVDDALFRDAYAYPPTSVTGGATSVASRFKTGAQPAYEPGADVDTTFDFKDQAAGDTE